MKKTCQICKVPYYQTAWTKSKPCWDCRHIIKTTKKKRYKAMMAKKVGKTYMEILEENYRKGNTGFGKRTPKQILELSKRYFSYDRV